jgi:hypothetical protein
MDHDQESTATTAGHTVVAEHDDDSASDTERSPLMGTRPAAATPSLAAASAQRRPTQAQGQTTQPRVSGFDRLRSLSRRPSESSNSDSEDWRQSLSKILAIIFGILLFFLLIAFLRTDEPSFVSQPGISRADFYAGLAKCRAIQRHPHTVAAHHLEATNTASTSSAQQYHTNGLRSNPRFDPKATPFKRILLHDGIVLDPVDGERRADVLIENGIITAINASLSGVSQEKLRDMIKHLEPIEVVNVGGRIITPGLIDMHR